MGSRKRAKTNPAFGGSPSVVSLPNNMPPRVRAGSSAASTASTSGRGTPLPSQPEDVEGATEGNSAPNSSSTIQVSKKGPLQSWYGSWPRNKSSASTQVARETILGGTLKPNATADFSRFETRKNPDAMSIDEPPNSAATPHKIPEDGTASTGGTAKPKKKEPGEDTYKIVVGNDENSAAQEQDKSKNTGPPTATPEQRPSTATASGWWNWFKSPEQATSNAMAPFAESTSKEPGTPKVHEQTPPAIPIQSCPEPAQPLAQNSSQGDAGGSWFSFWSKTQASPQQAQSRTSKDDPAPKPQTTEPEDVVMQDAPPAETPADAPTEPQPKAGSTWAFWSRDNGSKTSPSSKSKGESGQLAVIGECSESHPKQTTSMEVKDSPPVKEPPLKSARRDDQSNLSTSPGKDFIPRKSKRGRTQSMETEELVLARPSTPQTDTPARVESSVKPPTPKTSAASKPSVPNLVLPSFKSTYRMKDNPSIVKQIAQLLLRTQSPPANHVFLNKDLPKVKKAIAIGVHGLFPAQYLRPMIGQPTGTSLRFASHCADAIRRWANAHGCEDCEIEKVALEGEGKIGERAENLWRLLLNWIDHIRRADLIMIACHSQGVPVGIMLLAKLIELGIVTDAKIGVCAMAGVSLGPFPEYRSGVSMLMGSANELWEFANPESDVSQRLEAAVKAVLNYGARITYIGSIDDQLVPMESAVYSPAHHPYVYRSVFIDGRIHAPDFIAHLVGFALKLRNLGVSDQGLIRELSLPLAGSLYGGEGHSRLYDDDQVYDLAVVHTLETTDVGNVPCQIHKFEGLTNPNPYHLPWIMRGLLEQDFVKTELSAETAELLRQFDDWKPINKALKDVKYRLEAVRSKL